MAEESYKAAAQLHEHELWRSGLSRAYYAAYARCVAGLLCCGMTMPAKGNPAHKKLPGLILNNLTTLDKGRRAKLSNMINTLYKLRIAADYQPAASVDKTEARLSEGLMVKLFQQFKEKLP